MRKPQLLQPEDSTIYELRVRDFSITDETVPAAHRAPTSPSPTPAATGCSTCAGWPAPGSTPSTCCPCSTSPIPGEQRRPGDHLRPASFGPASEQQQACIGGRRDRRLQLGLRPVALHDARGLLRHRSRGPARARSSARWSPPSTAPACRWSWTSSTTATASGQTAKSVLDRIVPGYYRLSSTGTVETSTCCQNTATEHRMMEKLMVDSVVTWAQEYKVDGFRFDLMSHHSLANMLAVQEALDDLTLDATASTASASTSTARDGTSVRSPAETVPPRPPARALRLRYRVLHRPPAGRGPRRRAVRRQPRIQGFATGLYTDPNGDAINGTGLNDSACCCTTTRSRSGWPATCATTSSSTAPGRR